MLSDMWTVIITKIKLPAEFDTFEIWKYIKFNSL